MSISYLCGIFDGFKETVITIAIIAAIAIIAVALVKYKDARPYLVGLFAIAWFFSGVYSAFTGYKYYSTVSKVHGTLEEHDIYEDFDFYKYDIADFSLEKGDDGVFYYSKTYATSIEFNGSENTYVLLINNKPCDDTISSFGKLQGSTLIRFEDVDGNETNQIEVNVEFTFYSSSIKLLVTTSATEENLGLIKSYFDINGFSLRIIEAVSNQTPILSNKAT